MPLPRVQFKPAIRATSVATSPQVVASKRNRPEDAQLTGSGMIDLLQVGSQKPELLGLMIVDLSLPFHGLSYHQRSIFTRVWERKCANKAVPTYEKGRRGLVTDRHSSKGVFLEAWAASCTKGCEVASSTLHVAAICHLLGLPL